MVPMSNNNNIKTKMGALALVGVVVAATLLVAVAFSPATASAQQTRRDGLQEGLQRSIDRPFATDERPEHRLGINVARGAGIATNTETGDDLRSGFRLVMQKLNNSETNEQELKRGMLAISVDG